MVIIVVNFHCTRRSGPLSGPGRWGFSLISLMDDPAQVVHEVTDAGTYTDRQSDGQIRRQIIQWAAINVTCTVRALSRWRATIIPYVNIVDSDVNHQNTTDQCTCDCWSLCTSGFRGGRAASAPPPSTPGDGPTPSRYSWWVTAAETRWVKQVYQRYMKSKYCL